MLPVAVQEPWPGRTARRTLAAGRQKTAGDQDPAIGQCHGGMRQAFVIQRAGVAVQAAVDGRSRVRCGLRSEPAPDNDARR